MSVEGVDYAFPPIPSAAALKAAGKFFACRYGGPGSDSKQLTAAELAALAAAGVAVVANAEGAADGLLGGYAAGRSWAADAEQHFRALGMPGDRPIYLSVDFDANSTHWPALDAAMDGAASVLGRGRVGVYGSYRTVQHFASNRKAVWFWQTYAWSAGLWSPAAHIQQYRNGVSLGGASVDLNRAMTADYGQWGSGEMELSDIVHLNTNGGVNYSSPTTTVEGVLASTNLYVLLARNQAATALTALTSKVDGLVGTVQTLAAALAAGGSDIDTAAVLARIDQRAAEDAERDTAQRAEVEALQATVADLRAKLAAAAKAEAGALES